MPETCGEGVGDNGRGPAQAAVQIKKPSASAPPGEDRPAAIADKEVFSISDEEVKGEESPSHMQCEREEPCEGIATPEGNWTDDSGAEDEEVARALRALMPDLDDLQNDDEQPSPFEPMPAVDAEMVAVGALAMPACECPRATLGIVPACRAPTERKGWKATRMTRRKRYSDRREGIAVERRNLSAQEVTCGREWEQTRGRGGAEPSRGRGR